MLNTDCEQINVSILQTIVAVEYQYFTTYFQVLASWASSQKAVICSYEHKGAALWLLVLISIN